MSGAALTRLQPVAGGGRGSADVVAPRPRAEAPEKEPALEQLRDDGMTAGAQMMSVAEERSLPASPSMAGGPGERGERIDRVDPRGGERTAQEALRSNPIGPERPEPAPPGGSHGHVDLPGLRDQEDGRPGPCAAGVAGDLG